ncbi:MAG: Hsp20/alpha crystallin family protein [Candidatus Kapaibacterium sp.]
MTTAIYKPIIRDLEKFMKNFDSNRKQTGFMPPANIWHDKDNVYLEIELPGMTKENIKISVDDEERTLTINGTKEAAEKKTSRREIIYGDFWRQFYLGKKVNPESIKANYESGVLKITVAKLVPEVKEVEIK